MVYPIYVKIPVYMSVVLPYFGLAFAIFSG